MTQTGKIGLIGGMNIPPINSTFHALEEGAKSVNPDIKVAQSYVRRLGEHRKGEGVDTVPNYGRGGFHLP